MRRQLNEGCNWSKDLRNSKNWLRNPKNEEISKSPNQRNEEISKTQKSKIEEISKSTKSKIIFFFSRWFQNLTEILSILRWLISLLRHCMFFENCRCLLINCRNHLIVCACDTKTCVSNPSFSSNSKRLCQRYLAQKQTQKNIQKCWFWQSLSIKVPTGISISSPLASRYVTLRN